MNNKNYITRNFTVDFELRSEENESGVIIGRPIVYNSKAIIGNSFYEIIAQGALDNCDLSDVVLFVNHKMNDIPLARYNMNSESTMELNLDVNGLTFKAKLDIENNTEARKVYNAVKRGDLNGLSFAMKIKKESWDENGDDLPIRSILEIEKILEISIVNFPAYKDTNVSCRDEVSNEEAESILKANIKTNDKVNKDLELEKLKLKTMLKLKF